MKKFLFVENFSAGRKNNINIHNIIEKFCSDRNLCCSFIFIDSLCDNIVQDNDILVSVGGDGTINRILPFAMKYNKPIGIIPRGTANLLAAKLNIPSNIYSSLNLILNEKKQKIDILKINDNYSALRVGFGYDSDIICKTPQSLKNKFGYFAYFVAGILFALRLKQQTYHITLDNNKNLTVLATCVIVANAGNMYRNLVSVSKNCKLNDGKFDVFILKVKNPFLYFLEFLQIVFNKKSSNSKAMYFQTSQLTIKNTYCVCHIDGEKQKIRDNIHIEIIPDSVDIICNT